MDNAGLPKITVAVTVDAPREKAWKYYTAPEHIIEWNFAHPSWHCPTASNDVRIGGKYQARMEARDGNAGFDFEASYISVLDHSEFTYEFGGRHARVTFNEHHGKTEVVISFDPETENPIGLQQEGWQSILDNYKAYTESH